MYFLATNRSTRRASLADTTALKNGIPIKNLGKEMLGDAVLFYVML
jgi:hypothetical protein